MRLVAAAAIGLLVGAVVGILAGRALGSHDCRSLMPWELICG